jgi:hypothetical protein
MFVFVIFAMTKKKHLNLNVNNVPQEPSPSQPSEPIVVVPIDETIPAPILPLTTETGVTTEDTTDEAASSKPLLL